MHKFIEDIEKTISASAIILSSNIQKFFGPNNETVYLKGTLILIDSSILEISIFASKSHNAVLIEKYRFHFRDKHGQMIFRYDNAPHHHEIPSYPHHKHIESCITASSSPNLKNVLNEISTIILRR